MVMDEDGTSGADAEPEAEAGPEAEAEARAGGRRGAGRRGWAAALLNASGLGAGFLYLGAWWLAAVNVVGTAGLLVGASLTEASDRPRLWLGVYAGWLALVAAAGWLRARPRRPRATAAAPAVAAVTATGSTTAAEEPAAADEEPPRADSPTVTLAAPAPDGGPPPPAVGPDLDSPTMTLAAPPAAPPRATWRPFAVGVLLVALVATGVTMLRAIPQSEFDKGQEDHASGNCVSAVDHYSRVEADWTQFTLPSEPADARRERDNCVLLQRAQDAEAARAFSAAIDDYESYLDRYRRDGGPVWTGAEDHLAGLRLEYADVLAETALAETDPHDPNRYVDAVEAYAAVRQHHPDTPEEAEVDGRLDDLYANGTPALSEERYCDAVAELTPFAELSAVSPVDDAATLAERAASDVPRAHLGCGDTRYAAGDFCEAMGSFDEAAGDPNAPADVRASADSSLNQARYECGAAHLADDRPCQALEPLDAVDAVDAVNGGGVADRTRTALRGALYDCGLVRFRDRDHGGARELFQRVVDEYEGSDQARAARDMLIAVDVNEAGDRDPEQVMPGGSWTDSGGGSVSMEIYNASGEAIELLYAGPEYGRVTVEAGPDAGEGRCENPEGLPSTTITLPVGDYQTLARSTQDESVTAYDGVWRLDAGFVYQDCYYITEDGIVY
ncbi:tetratricopeptide repeat protein [Streptomyces sp. 4N509B]|uniref:tetratricopeptide repeat protein n=1 Tax=Streptomyces sp. 4N509B TaxID=3457413 RepID=UPI003FD40E3A